jgi:hypothetical protein
LNSNSTNSTPIKQCCSMNAQQFDPMINFNYLHHKITLNAR